MRSVRLSKIDFARSGEYLETRAELRMRVSVIRAWAGWIRRLSEAFPGVPEKGTVFRKT
jgi:hypothetical protein